MQKVRKGRKSLKNSISSSATCRTVQFTRLLGLRRSFWFYFVSFLRRSFSCFRLLCIVELSCVAFVNVAKNEQPQNMIILVSRTRREEEFDIKSREERKGKCNEERPFWVITKSTKCSANSTVHMRAEVGIYASCGKYFHEKPILDVGAIVKLNFWWIAVDRKH